MCSPTMSTFHSMHKDFQRIQFSCSVVSQRDKGLPAPAVAYVDDTMGSATAAFRGSIPFATLHPMNYTAVGGLEGVAGVHVLTGDAFDTLANRVNAFDAIWMDLTCTQQMVSTGKLRVCAAALKQSADAVLQLTLSCRGDASESVQAEMAHRMRLVGLSVHVQMATPGRDVDGCRTPVRMVTLCGSPGGPISQAVHAVRGADVLGRRVLLPRNAATPFFSRTRCVPDEYLQCRHLDRDYIVARTVAHRDTRRVAVELMQLCGQWQGAPEALLQLKDVERLARMYKNWACNNGIHSLSLTGACQARIRAMKTLPAPRSVRGERRAARSASRNAKMIWKRGLPPPLLRSRAGAHVKAIPTRT